MNERLGQWTRSHSQHPVPVKVGREKETNIKASWLCLKNKESTERTRNAKTAISHMTKTTTSTLHHNK
ncbi:hypothetical protein Lal_00002074 [Lupinus albus]|nr:hypothetical protein Lal_00002074 [Lupinus albus]